jgi:hypothetical protein
MIGIDPAAAEQMDQAVAKQVRETCDTAGIETPGGVPKKPGARYNLRSITQGEVIGQPGGLLVDVEIVTDPILQERGDAKAFQRR